MKNIAEEMGFPQALVSLRHQAVHKGRDGSMHSKGVIQFAFKEIQKFLNEQYWDPIRFKLAKRETQFDDFLEKLKCYRLVYDLKYKIPLFAEMQD